MMGFERSDDYQPLFWVRGRPVHVTTLLVGVHLFALVAGALLTGLNLFDPLPWMEFNASEVLHGQVWRVMTYVFVHRPENGLWFLIDMAMLFYFGREVERYFGRKVFATLYAGLTLTAPLVLLALRLVHGGGGATSIDGGNLVHFGVFIAFVTLYPNVQFFFSIPAVWIAGAFLAIYTLSFFSVHNWNELTVLWASVGVAFLGTRYASVGGEAFGPLGNLWAYLPRRTPPRPAPSRLKPRRAVDTPAHAAKAAGVSVGGASSVGRVDDLHESIDPLLDKISKHGLASLTNSERAILERARVSLLRKERGG